MKVEITIKNYRCFPDFKPAQITVQKGCTAFIGVNNSGKSSLLKFFYEFRPLFQVASTTNPWVELAAGRSQAFNFPKEVLTPQDVFCNATNSRAIEIQLQFVSDDTDDKEELQLAPSKIVISIPRNQTNFTALIYRKNQSIPPKRYNFDGVQLIDSDQNSPLVHMAAVLNVFKNLAETQYIGPFRNAINLFPTTNLSQVQTIQDLHSSYFDLTIGPPFIKKWRESSTGFDKSVIKSTNNLTNDLQEIFGFENLKIDSSINDQTFNFSINGEVYTLHELGSGLAQFFLVLANIALQKPSYILIDEPELNLHPLLQSRFLTTIAKYATQGILFATHSLGLARTSADRIYSVQKESDGGSRVTEYGREPRPAELLGELSFSGYIELGFRKILLVEGSTDLKVIQQFLRLYKKDQDVVLLPLRGREGIHNNALEGLCEVRRICEEVYALIDSERSSADAPLQQRINDFSQLCCQAGIKCHILKYRATENYLSEAAIKKVKGNKYRALQPYEKLGDMKPSWDKVENWLIAKEMTLAELETTDLGQFLRRVCEE
jgi:AAA15 family ATPase/GTPase